MRSHKDPLIILLEMKQKAIKNKTHYKIINSIDLNIKKEAGLIVDMFMKTNKTFPIMDSIIEKECLK